MVLYVNIKLLVFEGGYLNIYIYLDVFTSFWIKMDKIIFSKYQSKNTNCLMLLYNTIFY